MKTLRILLLLFMAFVVLMMAEYPGLYDSKRYFSSRQHYYAARRDYEAAPSPETQRAVEEARREIEEANRLDRRDILIFEGFMLCLLGGSVWVFVRAGKPGGFVFDEAPGHADQEGG
jgi:hypothetical protein